MSTPQKKYSFKLYPEEQLHSSGLLLCDHIESRLVKMLDDGCWFFRGRHGRVIDVHRPSIAVNGKQCRLARVMLEGRLGRLLYQGMQACHSCDVGTCIRPDHLFEASGKENAVDASRKGRLKRSAETRRKISQLQRGVKERPETIAAMIRVRTGRPLTDEHKAALSRALTGRKFSESHIEHMKIAWVRRAERERSQECQ